MPWQRNPVARFFELVHAEKKRIYTIYCYAILIGLIQLSLPIGIQAIINFVLAGSFSMSLALLITLVVTGVLITGLLHVGQMKVIETIQQKLFVDYAYAFSERLPRVDLKKADHVFLPELVNRFFEIPNLQKGMSKLLLALPVAIIQILFGLILLSFYHPAFILFGMVLISLLWLIIRFTGKKGLETSFASSADKYALAAWIEEVARLVKTFKFSKSTDIHLKKADERTSNYLKTRTQHFGILLLQYKALIAFKTLITATMLVVGSYLLLNQQLNIGQFVAAELVILTVLAAVEKIISNLDSVYSVLTSLDKIAKVTEKSVEVYGTQQLQEDKSIAVSFKNVSFSYQPDQKVVNNVSFDITAGEKVCIQGKEGCGKSSILRLMTGSYLDFEGAILINGMPVGNYDISSLRAGTGAFLSQQDIFQGTLYENIVMGSDAVPADEVIALAQQLGLYDFIVQSKDGLNTPLETAGKRLSATVIHKILLVRALVKKPRLILMEEPFAMLEEPYRTNLTTLLRQSPATVVAVSNDMSFAQGCHKIIQLN